jgi:hypothetical protein
MIALAMKSASEICRIFGRLSEKNYELGTIRRRIGFEADLDKEN